MQFSDFSEIMKKAVKVCLPKELQNLDIKVVPSKKNKGKIDVHIMIHGPNGPIPITVHLDDMAKEVKEIPDMKPVLKAIADSYTIADPGKEALGFFNPEKFDTLKNRVICKVVNQKRNENLLQGVPHTKLEDLAVMYRVFVEISKEDGSIGTMKITNELIEKWGVKVEELHELALKNTPRLFPAQFCPMSEIMREVTANIPPTNLLKDRQGHEADVLYVLTNDNRMYGAAVMFYPDILEQVQEIVGEPCYILPSSTHEVLLVPKSIPATKRELGQLVREVNHDEVQPDEVLSDRIYEYDREQKTLRQVKESLPNREVQER